MDGENISIWVTSAVLMSLRIGPVFLFAPPFTMMRVPKTFLALMSMGLAGLLVTAYPEMGQVKETSVHVLFIGGIRELFLGLVPVIVLQLMFGALYLVGRTIDVQAGFGLALLIDPTTRGQTPLFGTVFAYIAGVTFFAMNGHHDMLRFFAATLQIAPLGMPNDLAALSVLMSYSFIIGLVALGIGGAAILALFLSDIVIAMLARTVPQMNALLLGMQVKAILVFFVVPIAIGVAGALFAQMVANAIAIMPRLI